MARILFTLHPGIGHFNPLVPLATALQNGGHEVRMGTSASFGPKVEAAGLTAVPLGLDWVESRVEHAFPGFLGLGGDVQLQILAGPPAQALAPDVMAYGNDSCIFDPFGSEAARSDLSQGASLSHP